jgi:hypothetical protein
MAFSHATIKLYDTFLSNQNFFADKVELFFDLDAVLLGQFDSV